MDDFDLFLRFRVDGTLVEYPYVENVFGVFSNDCKWGTEALTVVAWDGTQGLRMRVSSFQANNPLGAYSIAHLENDSTFRMSMHYLDPEGREYYANPVVPEDATIDFTEVGPRTIGGAFLGVVKAAGRPDVVITDGEFLVRREHDISVCD